MRQGFQVLDVSGQQVRKVCVQFMYKGVMISASKIFSGYIHGYIDDEVVYEENTIEEVIIKIDSDKSIKESE
jgi:hypothetical protein